MRYGRISLAAMAAALVLCAPAMADPVHSPAYTEKITQAGVKTISPAQVYTLVKPVSTTVSIRFHPEMLQYAVIPLHVVPVSTFNDQQFLYANWSNRHTFRLAGDHLRALHTT